MAPIKAIEVARFVEERAAAGGYEQWDGGFLFGDPQDEVRRVGVTWMAFRSTLEKAVAAGCDMLVSHEGPFIGPGENHAGEWIDPAVPKTPPAERERVRIVEENNLTFFMCHFGLDKAFIFDDFAAVFGARRAVAGTGFVRVFEIEPLRLGDLVATARARLGLSALRFCGDPDRVVSRLGSMWGGVGTYRNSRVRLPHLMRYGADAIMAGEVDEFTWCQALEWDVPIVECGHAASEEPGLQNFADALAKRFPGLAVEFFPTPELVSFSTNLR